MKRRPRKDALREEASLRQIPQNSSVKYGGIPLLGCLPSCCSYGFDPHPCKMPCWTCDFTPASCIITSCIISLLHWEVAKESQSKQETIQAPGNKRTGCNFILSFYCCPGSNERQFRPLFIQSGDLSLLASGPDAYWVIVTIVIAKPLSSW